MQKASKNIIGEQLRRVRNERRWSQAELAAVCQRNGWNVTRETIARIEGCVRCVADFELFLIAESLEVCIDVLLPTDDHWKSRRPQFLDKYTPPP